MRSDFEEIGLIAFSYAVACIALVFVTPSWAESNVRPNNAGGEASGRAAPASVKSGTESARRAPGKSDGAAAKGNADRDDEQRLAAIRKLVEKKAYGEAETLALTLVAQQEGKPEKTRTDWAVAVWLGRIYTAMQRPAEVETWLRAAITNAEAAFGADHANTANTIDDLAEYLQSHGRMVEAEPLYQQSLAIRTKILGQTHPETASSLMQLGNLFARTGQYAKARPVVQEALDIRRKAFGNENRATLESMQELANLARSERQYPEAEKLYKRVLALRETLLGPNHADAAASLNALAALYLEIDRDPEAEKLLKRVLAIRERSLGADHWETLATLNELIRLYQKHGQQSAARPLMDRAQAILRANADRHARRKAATSSP